MLKSLVDRAIFGTTKSYTGLSFEDDLKLKYTKIAA